LRWRPAPIQATYLGFVGPVPMPELDFLFCDSQVVPDASAGGYFPQPLPIASFYQANDTQRVVGPATSRAESGLPQDAFVFCCFAKHYKVTEEVFTAWMMILMRLPHAVLWLAADNIWSERHMREQAEQYGIAPDRLVFAERVDAARYITRLAIANLFLDTFPYNAGTIASDAIRMGLPMLTVEGEAFASRMAARLLRAIDATDGITASLEGYVATAIALATEPVRYALYRERFSEGRWNESIGDMGRFTREYEHTLRALQFSVASEKTGVDRSGNPRASGA
jgi:predicted O-linked N-acetylglucosamine transferase (SPINDLY family)